jgi:hypothetical protein
MKTTAGSSTRSSTRIPTLSTRLLDPSNSAHLELASHVVKRVLPNALANATSPMLPLDAKTQGDIDDYDESDDQDFVAYEFGSTLLSEQDEEIRVENAQVCCYATNRWFVTRLCRCVICYRARHTCVLLSDTNVPQQRQRARGNLEYQVQSASKPIPQRHPFQKR